MKVMNLGKEEAWLWPLLCLLFKMLSVTKQNKDISKNTDDKNRTSYK